MIPHPGPDGGSITDVSNVSTQCRNYYGIIRRHEVTVWDPVMGKLVNDVNILTIRIGQRSFHSRPFLVLSHTEWLQKV